MATSYPASRRMSVKSGMSEGMGTFRCSLESAPVELEYMPVSAIARAGAQRALVQKALLKRIPSRPMRS